MYRPNGHRKSLLFVYAKHFLLLGVDTLSINVKLIRSLIKRRNMLKPNLPHCDSTESQLYICMQPCASTPCIRCSSVDERIVTEHWHLRVLHTPCIQRERERERERERDYNALASQQVWSHIEEDKGQMWKTSRQSRTNLKTCI